MGYVEQEQFSPFVRTKETQYHVTNTLPSMIIELLAQIFISVAQWSQVKVKLGKSPLYIIGSVC